MRWSYNLERSYAAAIWLACVALLVVAMVVVGGATRLTGSGLSITEWRPISGAVPPLSEHGWIAEFAKYQKIPQYQLVNRGLPLATFKTLYWWEWAHRLLGRLVGAAIFVPLLALLALRRIPRRLIWRCLLLLGLVGLEGLVGWWMVASGLSTRISVAPERLAVHLSIALLIFAVAFWTALEAWFGRPRGGQAAAPRLALWALALVAAAYVQIILGALVAGNRAGLVDTDWPLMAGRLAPRDYAPKGASLWEILAHNAPSVQFNHRLGAYLLFVLAVGLAVFTARSARASPAVRGLGVLAGVLVTMQASLGVLTLIYAAPLGLALTHQIGAVGVFASSLGFAWRVQRE
jgi:cytochrome c oxidase assembly protein subunit 15